MSNFANKKSPLQTKTLTILWRSLKYLKPYWQLTLGIYAAMLVLNVINLALPQFIRWIIDNGIYGNDLSLLGYAALGLLGMTATKGVIVYFQGGWTEIVSQHVAYDLRNAIQQKLNELPLSFHDQTQTGQILSRAMQDVERIRFLTGRAVLRILEGIVLMVGTAGVLVWMSPQLGLLIVLLLPVLIYRAYVFGSKFRPLSVNIQNQLGVLTTRIEQNLRGAEVVKGFAQENAEIERYIEENERWFGMSAEAAKLQAIHPPLLDMIANFGTMLILWYGGVLVFRGQLTLGELVAFTTYLAQLVQPIRLLGRIVPVLAIAASSGERIYEILDAEADIRDAVDAVEPEIIAGRVQFDKVSFGYDEDHMVIRDVSLKVEPGQVLALLGATGSGKSTIINLVSRFYDRTAGQIFIDDYDINRIPLRDLRKQIGIVLQDTRLFAGSIRQNIAFGKPEAEEAEIITAAQEAQAHDFIMEMPSGYDSLVGERGVTLSGGQKQRIAIARALITDPRILILDDATSSVDTQTEQLIQIALSRLMQDRTTFVIAHRLSTVRKADSILLLDKGRIAAQGTHQALLETSPQYAEIYRHQLRPHGTGSA
ncbi:MAG: ABC transporter ATP-binding protein [Anaerolineales bacterium]|nr:ABC transporter ATP-binding protein [Anaerolineales bacterium]